jgi:RNA polymerase sigma factor (sigma-70 family)
MVSQVFRQLPSAKILPQVRGTGNCLPSDCHASLRRVKSVKNVELMNPRHFESGFGHSVDNIIEMTQSDAQLLERYVEVRSEEAFAEIVRRYLNLIFSAALRQVRQPQLAEEVTQSVFVDLARRAKSLAPDTVLSAWLYQVARRTAIDVIRRESRRQIREQVAHELTAMNAPDTDWTQIEPLLEEGMDSLEEKERTALLLRYFQSKSFSEVGEALGINEDAARKRVSRSVERLREFFVRRGVSVSSLALTTTITTNAIQAAPAALGPTVISAALVSGATTTVSTTAISKIIAMTTIQKALVATTLVAAAAGVYQAREASNVRAQLVAAQQQGNSLSNQIGEVTRQRDELSGQLASSKGEKPKSGSDELLRLRGEIGQLRSQLAAASRVRREQPASLKTDENAITAEEAMKRKAIAKMNYARQWLMALLIYADHNQGQFPTNFAQADPFMDAGAKTEHDLKPGEFPPSGIKYGLIPDNYEMTYQGSLQAITNPSQQIVLREKQPEQTEDGGFVRTYGFADGHCEVHKAVAVQKSDEDGFRAWEAEHGLVAGQQQ